MGKEGYAVTDLITDGNLDMIHVCKRKGNSKRDFLFVNKLQGKHVPVSPIKVRESVGKLYELAYIHLHDKKNILVVGFAETATGIGELFFDYAINGKNSLDVVGFITTTREEVQSDNVISFNEEHSHAVGQQLCYDASLNVDTVVFVEDEISTGKTILNFVNEFNKVYTNITNYYVVSYCNWQTEEWKQEFQKNLVTPIAMFTGHLSNLNTKLDVKEKPLRSIDWGQNLIHIPVKYTEVRGAVDVDTMKENNESAIYLANQLSKKYFNRKCQIEVVGTEEFMGFPLKVAERLMEYGHDCYFHATTRSPILVSEDTIISDGVSLPSSYDKDRTVYLYDMDTLYVDKVLVLVEKEPTQEFVSDILRLYTSYRVEIQDVLIVCIQ